MDPYGPFCRIMKKLYVYLVSLGHLSVDLAPGALPAILPFFVLHNGLSYTEITGLMFASSFFASLVQPLFGYWSDKSERHWFMAAGILLSGIGLGITGITSNYWAIFVAVTLMGIGGAFFHPEAARLINQLSGKYRATGMGIFSVGGNAGFGVGPLIAAALITWFGLSGTVFFAIFGFIMAIVMWRTIPKIFENLNLPSSEKKVAIEAKEPGKNNWPAFGRLSFVILCRSCAFTGLLSFLPLYCIHRFGVSEVTASTLLAFLSITGIFMTLAGGWLTDKIGLTNACKVGYVLMAPAFALLIVAPDFLWFYPIIAVLSFTLNGTYSAYVVLGQSYLAKNLGFASGVTLGLSGSLGGIFTPIMGMIADAYGIDTVMIILVVVGVLCTLGAFLLPEPN